jgi:adenosylmethionine-8-amino-7-oxononanoate aminotransferase
MQISERDAQCVWHPYTKHFDSPKFPVVTKAQGSHLILEDGTRLLDAISSWWVNLHGHSHPYILQKIGEAMQDMQQVMFAGFTHPYAVELAEKILRVYDRNQTKVFFSDNGSTSVEVALKMCFQYWSNQDQPKKKIIALKGSYHGDTFGAMAVSERGLFNKAFWPFLFEVIFISPSLAELEKVYSLHGSEIAGLIFEPMVQGAGGMLMHDPVQLDAVLQSVKNHNGLIIADEVMTGFGRTGKLFGTHHLSTPPDIVCLSKGITGGMLPLGLTLATEKIFKAFQSSELSKALLHGHSFTGNVLSAVAGLASLDLLLQKETQENIQRISDQHEAFIKKLSSSFFKNPRSLGTVLAMEVGTESSSYASSLSSTLHQYFKNKGILLRPLGNTLYVLPPYSITERELNLIYDAILDLPLAINLEHIIKSSSLHANFLLNLSTLEKSGHEKLLRHKRLFKIQEKDFLEHIADEARHAQHLKQAASKLSAGDCKIMRNTKNYLTKLEVFILRELRRMELKNPRSCYVVLTYVIEKRAEKFYPQYETILSSTNTNFSVSSIISDEANHLELMKQELAEMHIPTEVLIKAQTYEDNLFQAYMEQFSEL